MRAGNRKVTSEEVFEMRRKYEAYEMTQGQLARAYGISVGQVGRIVRGESWQGSSGRRVEAAPPKQDPEAFLQSLIALQGEVSTSSSLPPSPLEGGDAPSVRGGLEKLEAERVLAEAAAKKFL